jgi:hypothetical protein
MSFPGIPEQLKGSLDGVIDGLVSGWAVDVASPTAPVELEILINGELVGRALSDRYREDLVVAGIGSGRHGFAAPVGPDWQDGLEHEVRVFAAGTDYELDGSPRRQVFGGQTHRGPRPGRFAADTVRSRRGSLDAVWRRLASGGRLAVMAVYQPVARLPSHLTAYLDALRANDIAVVVVDATPGGLDVPVELAPLVLQRENVGWDFASWLAGLDAVRSLIDDADELLLTNDSAFGPLFPLAESWAHERVRDADFWGLTDSWQSGYHLQSYFLVLRRRALTHPALWRFLEDYPFPAAKRQVVRDGEIGLTSALLAAGLRSAVTCPYEAVARRWLDGLPERLARVRAYPENAFLDPQDLEVAARGRGAAQGLRHILDVAYDIRRGLSQNPTHVFWDTLLADFRCPLIKRELLLVNPTEVPYATEVRGLMEALTDYDPGHIVDAARLMRSPRVPMV